MHNVIEEALVPYTSGAMLNNPSRTDFNFILKLVWKIHMKR